MGGEKWTRPETLAAFALYCRLPFGKLHSRNPEIIMLAEALGRTPASVAMKCCNLASLDDAHRDRGVRGLQKVSFMQEPEPICFEAARCLANYLPSLLVTPSDDIPPSLKGTEREAVIKIRVNQRYFRDMILASYGSTCAVCGLPFFELLVASHIVPWSHDENLRMNPCNGICLCGTHDLAFERGLLRIHSDFSLYVSQSVADLQHVESVREWLFRYAGRALIMPDRWKPDPILLARRLAMFSDKTTP
jgi:putative restriction endonuclease